MQVPDLTGFSKFCLGVPILYPVKIYPFFIGQKGPLLLASISVFFKVALHLMQQGYSLRTFTGHSASVMSLDFHPNKEDLICSCDGDGEVRYWSINNGSCIRVFKVSFLC